MLGRRLGRFRILEELGRGGMGTVWKARDELLGRVVAVKVLGEVLSADAAERRTFRKTAEIAASLDHPRIVPVYEAGEFEELAYLVMKFVDGETLERFVSRRLPPESDVLHIAASVADALSYAHGRDVIHRDITPRNIMLNREGDVYVLDFGLARVVGATASSTGHVVGTPAYLAPERLGGAQADARSDLYGLGAVLYEALTGTRPFHGETAEALFYNIMNGTVEPPRCLRSELDLQSNAVIMRLLSRDPAGRPSSADKVASELRSIMTRLVNAGPSPDAPGSRTDGAASVAPVSGRRAADGRAAAIDGTGLADRVASGRTRAYLAVLPIEHSEGTGPDPKRQQLVDDLAEALRAGLANSERLHIVAPDSRPDPGESDRTFARRVGANLLLRSSARWTGTVVRILFGLHDPESGSQIAGGSVDGSLLQPMELEDRLVAAVREGLAFSPGLRSAESLAKQRDPAAQERFTQAISYLSRFDNEASIDGAISLLERLLASEGESAAVHAALARAYLHKYQQTQQRAWEARAAQACERATRLDPCSPEALLAIGELHTAAGRSEDALVALDRALALSPDCFEAHLAHARALDGAGRAEEAEGACRRAMSIRPSDWRAYHVLGLVLFRKGRYPEAVAPWRHVTELTPDNASGHRNLGSALFHLDRFDDALVALHRANAIRPHGMAYYNVGTVLFYLERYEESIEAFEKSVALAPADPWSWGNLGDACRRVPGQEARMKEALERAIALMRERLDRERGDGEDLARLAGWLENLGRREEAECTLRLALERSPDNVHCMVAAGITLLNLGARDEAIEWLRRAVRSGYGTDALRRSPYLRQLAGDAEFQRILEDGSRPGAVAVNDVGQRRHA